MTGGAVEDSRDRHLLDYWMFSNVRDSLSLFWHVIEARGSIHTIFCKVC